MSSKTLQDLYTPGTITIPSKLKPIIGEGVNTEHNTKCDRHESRRKNVFSLK